MENNDGAHESNRVFEFEGKVYPTYLDMVVAKRKRNQDRLEQSGLLKASIEMKENKRLISAQRGLNRKKQSEVLDISSKRRKSNRLAGVQADGLYVENERSGNFLIAGSGSGSTSVGAGTDSKVEEIHFYNNRINGGDSLSLKEAVELCDSKWTDERSVTRVERFGKGYLSSLVSSTKQEEMQFISTKRLSDEREQVFDGFTNLSVDDNNNVAKVTPDRIYSVSCHPSPSSLLVCAGDKQGYIGLWNVDGSEAKDSEAKDGEAKDGEAKDGEAEDGVYLFHIHNRPVSCLEWTSSGSSLISASYDGTVRMMDVESQQFTQIFATYDSSGKYKEELGYGLDEFGRNSWIQYCTMDTRHSTEKSIFLSTSSGHAYHVDLRAKGLSFHEDLSEKKINTLSLHPDGNLLASAGLDCMIKIWDLRKFGDSRKARTARNKAPQVVSEFHGGKSINSAFFSSSGSAMVATTMADTLDIFKDPHLAQGKLVPQKRIHHNNRTGRWLSTFMAKWHESLDVFVVGSMQHPRTMEVFNSDGSVIQEFRGVALTAVTSRCCFHPSTDRLAVIGGNSSGRICVAR